MDQSESTDKSGKTKIPKLPLKNALTYVAIALALASGGYSMMSQTNVDKTLSEHNAKLNSLNSKTNTIRLEMSEDEDAFDIDGFKTALTSELEAKITSANSEIVKAMSQRIAQVEQQSQNIDLDEILAQADLGSAGELESLKFDIKALQESQNAIRADVEKAKSYAMRSDQRTVNYASTINQLESKIAQMSINGAMLANNSSSLTRLPEFSVLSVIPQGKYNVIVVQSPTKKGKPFNTITLVKDERFTSKLGQHTVKDIIVNPKTKTAKIVTKDGFFIDTVRENMTPTLLAKYKKKSPIKRKVGTKKVSPQQIAKASPKKETRLEIKEWEVLTRYADTNTAVVINSKNGQTAEIKPSDILKGYGRVVDIDKRTGRINFEGYYIEGLDI